VVKGKADNTRPGPLLTDISLLRKRVLNNMTRKGLSPFISYLLVLFFTAPVMASMPVPVTITGCVMKGIILSELTDFGSYTSKRSYEIKPINADRSSFDLNPYEGSVIRGKGHLLPGDRFVIDPESIKIIGPCGGSEITADEAERIVLELPEVRLRADKIRKGGARPFTRIESVPEPDAKPGSTGSAYTIYFGEDGGTHAVRAMTFQVDAHTRKISVYDVVTDSVLPLEEWRKTQEVVAVSEERIVFVRNGNIWIAKIDGTGQKQLTFSGQDRDPVISRDGKSVAYASGNDEHTGFGHIYTVPSVGGTPKKLELKGVSGSAHPYFSPWGDALVFVGMSDVTVKKREGYDMTHATMSIIIVDLKTGKTKKIARTRNVLLDVGYIYSSPSFSPDGKLVAFQHSGSDVSGGFSIVDLEGRMLFHFPRKQSDPTPYWRPLFSPDGKDILCYSPATSESTTDAIYRVNRKTGIKRKVTEGAHPAFAADGRAIVFEKWVERWKPEGGAKSDLWYLELTDGARPKKIFDNVSQPSGRVLSTKEK
jgi:TolB protein